MPVYNVKSSYLEEAVLSVLEQSFCNFELLIVDDGSTNGFIHVLNNYHDSRIKLIINHHNFIDSLNKGLSESKGKYIVRMDADDIMLPHRLQTQYDYMENHTEIDICGSWAEMFGQATGVMHTPTDHTNIVSQLLLQNVMIHPSIIMRKSSLRHSKYSYGYSYAEDYKLWIDLVLNGLRFANIPEVLLQYRISQTQVTQIYTQKMSNSTQKIRLQYIEQIMKTIQKDNECYTEVLNPLIDLLNNDLISFACFGQIIYQLYYDFKSH